MKGEKPSVVIRDASQFGDAFAQQVRDRAVAAKKVYADFSNSEERKAACLTLDAVNAVGGVDKTTEEQIAEFARQQFDRRAKAEEFASNLAKLTQLDVTGVPALYCTAYDVREPAE
jgi:uncharacterized protein YgbK (DUF1537 family)